MSPERIRPGSAREREAAEERSPEAGARAQQSGEPEAADALETPVDERLDLDPAEGSGSGELGDDELAGFDEAADAGAEASIGRLRSRAARRSRETAEEDAELAAEALTLVTPETGGTPGASRASGAFRRLYYGRTHFDFVRRSRLWFTISGIILLAGVISLATRGLNLSIDFVGGTSWTVPAKTMRAGTTQAVSEIRTAVTPYGLAGATITELGVGSNATIEVSAKLATSGSSAATTRLESQVATAIGRVARVGPESVSITSVGPSWGSEITNKAIEALIVFFVLIAIYISIFFEWRMALGAILAVAHDVLVVVGIYSLTGLEVTPDTVVAVLTILGYSLYDTIVVFDRVRDNVRALGPSNKLTISDLVNLSMNQTLARSINTSLVAILPILAVLILGAELLGATTLEYFGFALLIGLTSGAYSSIFIASPIVARMKEREPRWARVRTELAKRGVERLLLSPADIAAGVLTPEGGIQRPQRDRRAKAAARGGRIQPGAARQVGSVRPGGEASAPAAGLPGSSDAGSDPVPSALSAGNGSGRQPSPRGGARPGSGRPPARARRKGGRR